MSTPAGTAVEPILQVENLQVSYGPVPAVRGASFSVGAGEIVALLGANGAGKTSTLNAIQGLLRGVRGSIRLLGRPLTSWPAHQVTAAGVALCVEGRGILGPMTVEENLELGAYLRRDRHAVREDLAAMYERFPILYDRRFQAARNLSGGEQQMLAIARALMSRPRLLMLDEPSMGLAPKIVDEVFDILASLRTEGYAILLAEQNAAMASTVAQRGYVLRTGIMTDLGPVDSWAKPETLTRAYLGPERGGA